MPRKTSSVRTVAPRGECFNEAAARCRGKLALTWVTEMSPPASMRPRPDAAENVVVGREQAAVRVASMRPRPDAAENFGAR